MSRDSSRVGDGDNAFADIDDGFSGGSRDCAASPSDAHESAPSGSNNPAKRGQCCAAVLFPFCSP